MVKSNVKRRPLVWFWDNLDGTEEAIIINDAEDAETPNPYGPFESHSFRWLHPDGSSEIVTIPSKPENESDDSN